MRLGVMVTDLARSAFQKPITEKYPFERQISPDRLRGMLRWDPAACIGCALCAKDCPSGAIELIVIDKKAKLFQLIYHVDRCTFCAQCVESCRQECLWLSNQDWELAALDPAVFQIIYQGREDGDSELAAADPTDA